MNEYTKGAPRQLTPVLFAEQTGTYATEPRADVWHEARDARRFAGDAPVIAHPPCRLWCRLAHQSTAPDEEKALAVFALATVRKNGGILEHPYPSRLWRAENLPPPGQRDANGWTMLVDQVEFGHPCRKRTLLYISGLEPAAMPPYGIGAVPTTTVDRQHSAHRNKTPPAFAAWLLDIAERIAAAKR